MVNFKEITIPEDHIGRRLDRFLRHFFSDLSQADLEKLLRSKMLRLNGQKAKTDTRITDDAVLRYPDFLVLNEYSISDNSTSVSFPREIILYEDGDLMVINKPHGLASQGGSNMKIHLDMLLETLPKRNGYRPSTVHRLDKDTSGCLVIAKKRTIAAKLGEALKERQFKKYYLAITESVPHEGCGVIENFVAKSQTGKQDSMNIVSSDTPKAQFAKSLYYVTSHNSDHDKALLLMAPITGRTHQLRLHCQSLDCSIVGDGKYNNDSALKTKLCLHAAKIIFEHPTTEKMIEIDAPIPEHFRKTADKYQLSLKNPVSYENKEMIQQLLKPLPIL